MDTETARATAASRKIATKRCANCGTLITGTTRLRYCQTCGDTVRKRRYRARRKA